MEIEPWMLILLPILLLIQIAKRIWGKNHGRSGYRHAWSDDHSWHDDDDSGWHFDFDFDGDDGGGD
ncbi:MAG: hypothetical protein P1U85_23290 [Verrucomicrobiales bacterium]|jgi:hypothetical protein|nr:hypothetical protein [Verrucomicrobiales bacterium]